MESVGFKEWAIVCEALGRGEQTILLRKGGIAEGRDGFGFRHSEFFLFPTFFHEQIDKVRSVNAAIPEEREGEIEVRYFAKLVEEREITSWPKAAALAPFHILEESVVRERFDYKQPGLYVALVRVFLLKPRWVFPDTLAYRGCQSWVRLPDIPAQTPRVPVLTDRQHGAWVEKFRSICPKE